jgi:hypothetical protein
MISGLLLASAVAGSAQGVFQWTWTYLTADRGTGQIVAQGINYVWMYTYG